MPFFKDLRRRSKASFHTSKSSGSKSVESHCNGEMPSEKSSSTVDTSSYKSVTPPPSIQHNNRSSPNLPSLTEFNGHSEGSSAVLSVPPPRPGPFVSQLSRNSTIVRPGGSRLWLLARADHHLSVGKQRALAKQRHSFSHAIVSIFSANHFHLG